MNIIEYIDRAIDDYYIKNNSRPKFIVLSDIKFLLLKESFQELLDEGRPTGWFKYRGISIYSRHDGILVL